MPVDQSPIYRKVIVPWYDAEGACIIVLIFMCVVFLFAISGIYVARETPEYKAYQWVAVLLTGLSGWVMISTGFRLIKRYASRYSK